MSNKNFTARALSRNWVDRVVSFLPYPMLLGIGAMLLGLLLLEARGDFTRIFYLALLTPAIFLVILRPSAVCLTFDMIHSRLLLCFLLYAATTLFWARDVESVVALLKPPIYVVFFFIVASFLARTQGKWLAQIIRGASLLVIVLAIWNLWVYAGAATKSRLEGVGVLTNPLLISHAYGFYSALWVGFLATGRGCERLWAVLPLGILCALLYATGSRTPMVAILASVLWVALIRPRREVLIGGGILLALLGALFALNPEALLQRGLSYRTEIWAEVLRQSERALVWGHGHGAELQVKLDGIPYPLSDPHNMTLSVLFRLGLVGVVLWGAMYATFLHAAWKHRADAAVVIFSTAVVYGLMAGMTEGGSFLSRPKEHWLLIWVPLGLLNAALQLRQAREGYLSGVSAGAKG